MTVNARSLTQISVDSSGNGANNIATNATMSGDGRYVGSQSTGTNLVGGDTNGGLDVFMKDTSTGVTTRVSTASDGSQANGISQNLDITGDGHFVAFQSTATNLVSGDSNGTSDVFVKNLQTNAVTRVSVAN